MKRASVFLDPLYSEKKGETVRFRKTHEYGQRNVIARHPRRCPECGIVVSKYKDPHLSKAWCYLHDDLTPWTRQFLLGAPEDKHQKQRVKRWTGIGRGNGRKRERSI